MWSLILQHTLSGVQLAKVCSVVRPLHFDATTELGKSSWTRRRTRLLRANRPAESGRLHRWSVYERLFFYNLRLFFEQVRAHFYTLSIQIVYNKGIHLRHLPLARGHRVVREWGLEELTLAFGIDVLPKCCSRQAPRMIGHYDPKNVRMTLRVSRIAIAAAPIVVLVFASADAFALVVETTDTTVNPAMYSGWTQGDPGWANVTEIGANYVYLGDRWILSARHVGISNAAFSTGTFTPIAGENYVIHNPPSSLAGGLSLTSETDLQLIRINGDPGLPALTIASQSPPSSGSNGSQVVFVGHGPSRLASATNWQVDTTNPNSWIWTEVVSGGNFHGYKTTGPPVKRWGTNRLASPGAAAYQSVFSNVLSSTSGVLTMKGGDNVNRDVISLLSSFDQQGQNGALPFETQVVSGDSGSAVFYKNGSQWQLAGIINTTLIYNNQAVLYGVYGDAATFADLSYYNKPYQGSICDVMKNCGNYSVVGDVNLDGIISGDGSGLWQTDNVTAFVAGWNFDNGAGAGDYNSWTHGDMDHDGKTDVNDFFLFRDALDGQPGAAALNSLLATQLPFDGGNSLVPEPSASDLATVVAALLGFGFSIHRRRGSLTSGWSH